MLSSVWGGEPRTIRCLVVAACGLLIRAPAADYGLRHWRLPIDTRHDMYRQAAHYVRQNVSRRDEILALEIGVFGYFSERRILDLGGLVSPSFTRAKLESRRPELVESLRPPYVLYAEKDRLLNEILDRQGLRVHDVSIARFRSLNKDEVEVLEYRD